MTLSSLDHEFQIDVGEPSRPLHGRVVGAAGDGQTLRPCVVAVHGYLASMDWGFMPLVARALEQRGIATVCFDLTGSGVSRRAGAAPGQLDDERGFSTNTYSQELEDLAAVTELVRCGAIPGVDSRRVGLFGHSRGAAMALVHAAEARGFRALCSWSAGGHVARYDPHRLIEWEQRGHLEVELPDGRRWRLERDLFHDFTHNAARFDLVAAAARFEGAWLIVNGARDRATPVDEVESFVASVAQRRTSPPRLQLVDGAGHNFQAAGRPPSAPPPVLRVALDATVEFFRRELA